jgi:hypothetical protein
MFKKLNTWLKSREEAIKKEQELRKAKRYYAYIKAGMAAIKFIQDDLKRTENTMNRHQRRRFEKEIEEKGMFSPELVNYYQQKIDWLLVEVDKRLNPPKVQPQNNNGVQVRNTPPPGAKVVELGKQESK